VREWGCEGAPPGLFQAPRDIVQAPDGSLIVIDTYNHRLQRFVKDESADDDPPTTTCEQRTGWWAAPLDLVLSATDGASEVVATWVSVDGSRFHAAAGPVELRAQGTHVVRYLSVDAAGNQERIRRSAFVLDWQAPGVRFGARTALHAFTGAPVRPRFSVDDALSPSCQVWLRLDRDGEQVWLKSLGRVDVSPSGRAMVPEFTAPRAPGSYVLTVTARDRAGNVGRRSLDLLVRGR
jgi:hypothetical protein